MKVFSTVVTAFAIMFSVLSSQTTLASKFAPEKFQHCEGWTDHERCKKRIARVYRDGCITLAEMNEALEGREGKEIIPVCSDDDDIGKDNHYHGWCFCSCFLKGTRILVEEKATGRRYWEKIEFVTENGDSFRVVTLSENATTKAISLSTSDIRAWSAGMESGPVFVITMDDGTELTVTGNHSLVLANGLLIDAKDVKVGDIFVNVENREVTVTNINQKFTNDEVFNVLLTGKEFRSHLLFAETILVGDALFENSSEEQVRAVYVGPEVDRTGH